MSGPAYVDRLADYVDVAERIAEFYQKYPEGRIQTEVTELTAERVTVKALAYRTPDDPLPSTGHSWLAIPGTTPYTRGSEIENAETSAVGRAIVMAGIPSKKVASADEVRAKALDDKGQVPQTPPPKPQPPIVKPLSRSPDYRSPEPPFDEAFAAKAAAAQQQSYQFTTPPDAPAERKLKEGDKHDATHKPLVRNTRGLFCPTHLQDGSWCQWTERKP